MVSLTPSNTESTYLPPIKVMRGSFLELTINSIYASNPTADVEVIDIDSNIVKTAHEILQEPSLVVKAGVVLNVKPGDFPPEETLMQYDMAVSRETVFQDHPQHSNIYHTIGEVCDPGSIDTNIFFVKPLDNFQGVSKLKSLKMPRYLNHKEDYAVSHGLSSYQALQYGIAGVDAAVYNYVLSLTSGATPMVNETYAYHFDKLAPHANGLPPEEYDRVMYLASLTTKRISSTRDRLYRALNT